MVVVTAKHDAIGIEKTERSGIIKPTMTGVDFNEGSKVRRNNKSPHDKTVNIEIKKIKNEITIDRKK